MNAPTFFRSTQAQHLLPDFLNGAQYPHITQDNSLARWDYIENKVKLINLKELGIKD